LDEVKSLLSIPAELEVLAIIPFGYPAQPIGKGKKKRKSISESPTSNDSGGPLNNVGSEGSFLATTVKDLMPIFFCQRYHGIEKRRRKQNGFRKSKAESRSRF
jgi:hypothetical protein